MVRMVFFVYIFCICFITLVSAIEEYDDACLQKRGISGENGCYCKLTSRYMEPEEICFSKALEEFLDIGKTGEPPAVDPCPPDPFDYESLPLATSTKIEYEKVSDVCANPAKYLCKTDYNPYVGKLKEAKRIFDMEELSAEKHRKVQDFIRKKSKGKATRCYELDKKDSIECVSKRNEILENKIYTKNRKEIALDLFEKGKRAIITVLKKRLEMLEEMGLQNTKSNLDKMIIKINNANITFSSNPSRALTFGARAGREDINIEGMILSAEIAPEKLYGTILHELAHIVDLRFFREDSEYNGNPFQRELKCLKRKDSLAAASADIDCFFKTGMRYRDKYPKFAKQIQTIASYLRKNPEVSYKIPRFPQGNPCQIGQLNEGLADWLAMEAYVVSSKLPSLYLKTGLYRNDKSVGDRFIDIKKRLEKLPGIAQYISAFCAREKRQNISYGPHPLPRDRLNGVMLAHPLIKLAIGCTPKDIYNLEDLDAPILQKRKVYSRVYCGPNLYPPFRTKDNEDDSFIGAIKRFFQ